MKTSNSIYLKIWHCKVGSFFFGTPGIIQCTIKIILSPAIGVEKYQFLPTRINMQRWATSIVNHPKLCWHSCLLISSQKLLLSVNMQCMEASKILFEYLVKTLSPRFKWFLNKRCGFKRFLETLWVSGGGFALSQNLVLGSCSDDN